MLKKLERISLLCLLTWHYYQPSLAQTTRPERIFMVQKVFKPLKFCCSNGLNKSFSIECLFLFLAHLSLLRVSFWDTVMSVVRRTCGRPRRTRRPRRPSVNFLACVHSRGNSFDPKFMKLCQNVNHHNI